MRVATLFPSPSNNLVIDHAGEISSVEQYLGHGKAGLIVNISSHDLKLTRDLLTPSVINANSAAVSELLLFARLWGLLSPDMEPEFMSQQISRLVEHAFAISEVIGLSELEYIDRLQSNCPAFVSEDFKIEMALPGANDEAQNIAYYLHPLKALELAKAAVLATRKENDRATHDLKMYRYEHKTKRFEYGTAVDPKKSPKVFELFDYEMAYAPIEVQQAPSPVINHKGVIGGEAIAAFPAPSAQIEINPIYASMIIGHMRQANYTRMHGEYWTKSIRSVLKAHCHKVNKMSGGRQKSVATYDIDAISKQHTTIVGSGFICGSRLPLDKVENTYHRLQKAIDVGSPAFKELMFDKQSLEGQLAG